MNNELLEQDGSWDDPVEETERLVESNRVIRYPDNQFFGRVLLLNSPKGTGKDYLAERLCLALGARYHEFKAPMFDIAVAMTGLSRDEFFEIYNDRSKKELPQPEFFGMSPRGFMIWLSEDVMKPKFGDDHFGRVAAQGVDYNVGAVFSDSGFHKELVPLVDRIGAENVYVCRFTRDGAEFDSTDSRGYLDPELCPDGVKFLPFMANDGCIQELTNKVSEWVMTY